MDSLFVPFVMIALILVITILVVERFFHMQQDEVERSKLIAAVLSKDMSEYTHAVRVEKEVAEKEAPNPDEVEVSQLDDKAFDKFITQQAK